MADPHELPLETIGAIDNMPFWPDNPRDALRTTVISALGRELTTMLTSSEADFAASEVPSRFASTIRAMSRRIVAETLHSESRRLEFSPKPLTNYIQELGLKDYPAEDIVLSGAVVQDLEDQATNLRTDFSSLERSARAWEGTQIMDLVRTVGQAQAQTADSASVDQAYRALEAATDHPEDYTLPLNEPESLFLICFMREGRSLTRRFVVGNFIAAKVAEELGPDMTEASTAMLAALRQYYRADALGEHTWGNLIRTRGMGEESAKKVALLSIEEMKALAALQQLALSGEGNAFIGAYQNTVHGLKELMEDTTKLRLYPWQSIDIGHGFENFQDHAVSEALFLGDRHMERAFHSPEKNGQRAVILEDDPRQMTAWQTVLDKHSAFTVEPEDCFVSPDGLIELADDPSVGVFLLDIQNGEDQTAGIRLGEEILRRRLQFANNWPGGAEKAPKATIVIWSTSPESVALASAKLKPLLESYRPGISFDVPGSGSSCHANPIRVIVRQKSWQWYGSLTAARPRADEQ